jgi:hypothetical protein
VFEFRFMLRKSAACTIGALALLGVEGIAPVSSSATTLPAGTSFSYTGADQTYAVPSNVCAVTIYVAGAEGGTDYNGGAGGAGGVGSATVPVTPGSTLAVVVGSIGGFGYIPVPNGVMGNKPSAVYGGGGAGTQSSGSGGGLSGVYDGKSALVIAGGGGGAGALDADPVGGAGGNVNQPGAAGDPTTYGMPSNASGGEGGTLMAGGAGGVGDPNAPGTSGASGNGGSGGSTGREGGGGGGGGYFGGGGGGGSSMMGMPEFGDDSGSGGGGGSGFAASNATNVSTTWAGHSGRGNGAVEIDPSTVCSVTNVGIFAYGQSTLSATVKAQLVTQAKAIKAKGYTTLSIHGYANPGAPSQLGTARANAAAQFLTTQLRSLNVVLTSAIAISSSNTAAFSKNHGLDGSGDNCVVVTAS